MKILKILFMLLLYRPLAMNSKFSSLLLGILITCVFASKAKAQTAKQNLNISFLLDLSDRISPRKNPNATMQYYQRDLQYIRSIERAFVNHIKQKRILQLNDQMQVFFDPEPENAEINRLSQQLKVSFNSKSNKSNIENVDKIFSTLPMKIYQSAIKDNHYIGSDIWSFFKNKVEDYCIKDKHRNILVIITDGYMYHKDSKFLEKGKSSYITADFIQKNKLSSSDYQSIIKKNNLGFIAFPHNLKELEVVVLGINPSKKNPYEGDVIKQYWSDWFRAMKVKKFYIKTADLPADLEPVLQDIIIGANKIIYP